jgi:hypothetical protein
MPIPINSFPTAQKKHMSPVSLAYGSKSMSEWS